MDALGAAKRIVADVIVAEQNRASARTVSMFRRCRLANSAVTVFMGADGFRMYCAPCNTTSHSTRDKDEADAVARNHKLLHVVDPK